jgi:hypothetical protein
MERKNVAKKNRLCAAQARAIAHNSTAFVRDGAQNTLVLPEKTNGRPNKTTGFSSADRAFRANTNRFDHPSLET